jgi:hypothetical protein
MNLNGIIMKEIPKDYKSLRYGTIAIMNKDTNEIVVIISFSSFKKMSKEKYEEIEDLTKTFSKMKDQINPITNNKSMVGGIMYALGWSGGFNKGKFLKFLNLNSMYAL